MKKNKKIIISSSHMWGVEGIKVGLHFFGEYFLKKNYDVFWITIPFSLFSFLRPKFYKEKILKLGNFLKGGRIYHFNKNFLINFSPLTLFHPKKNNWILDNDFIVRNYLRFSFFPLKMIFKKYGFQNPDIFLFDSGGINSYILKIVNPKIVIYRLSDLSEGFKDLPYSVIKLEKELLKNSDLVLAVSKKLFNYALKARGKRKGLYFLPNGVDVKLFSKKFSPPLLYKKKLGKIAVFVGGLDFWFDWNLVLEVAKKNKDISFVIIGKGSNIPSFLPKNIFLLGPIPHQKVVAYLKYADVGLIPFRNLPIMNTIERPLKFYEYLAAGLPIVSVSYGDLKKGLSPYAFFGNTPEEFSKALNKALKVSPKERDKFKKIAKKFSWDNVFKRLEKILKKYQ